MKELETLALTENLPQVLAFVDEQLEAADCPMKIQMQISTGKVTAANAGHEYPILKKANGEFELLKDKHGFVIGGMEGVRYKEYEFQLERGGTLFLYTDGVAEATDVKNELFGTQRMLDALNQDPDADPKTLLSNMKAAVDEFVGKAPQFDDLTMLGVKLL